MPNRRLIERYILRTIFPYSIASLILLTAILFAQQTGRYFETIFHGVMPSSFVYGLALALLPTVLVFTIPMAVLSGTIIGLGRMGSDSELVAMRAAGVSTWRMLWPALALGLIATRHWLAEPERSSPGATAIEVGRNSQRTLQVGFPG